MREGTGRGYEAAIADEISCGKQKPSLNLSFQESIHNPLMTFSTDRSSSLFYKREISLPVNNPCSHLLSGFSIRIQF